MPHLLVEKPVQPGKRRGMFGMFGLALHFGQKLTSSSQAKGGASGPVMAQFTSARPLKLDKDERPADIQYIHVFSRGEGGEGEAAEKEKERFAERGMFACLFQRRRHTQIDERLAVPTQYLRLARCVKKDQEGVSRGRGAREANERLPGRGS